MIWRFTLSNGTYGTLVLDDEPIGWADIALTIARDMNWHGVFFNYASTLKFYGTGFNYLKNVYENNGIDDYVELQIDQKCSDTDAYTSFYTGKILLGKLLFDCTDDCMVETSIDPAGCLMEFKNRVDQAVDLNANKDFNGDSLASYSKLPFNLTLLPKAIVLRELPNDPSVVNIAEYHGGTQSIANGTGSQHIDDFNYMPVPTSSLLLNEIDVSENTTCVMADSTGGMPVVMTAPTSGTYNVDINITSLDFALVAVTGGSGPTGFSISATLFVTVNGSTVFSDLIFSNSTFGRQILTNMHWNQDFVISQGQDLKIFIRWVTSADFARDLVSNYDVYFDFNDHNTLTPLPYQGAIYSKIAIKETILTDPTDCQVYAVNEALSRVVESITNDCMRVKSDYFGRTDSQPYTSARDGCGSLEVITKGLYIRQFPLPATVMSIAFQDLFDSLNAIHNIGIGIEPDTSGRTDLICTTFGSTGWTVGAGHHVYYTNYFNAYSSFTITINVTTYVNPINVYFGTALIATITSGGVQTITGTPVGNLNLDIVIFDSIIGDICQHTGMSSFSWLRIEPVSYFYDSTVILQFDNVPAIKKTVMAEWFASTLNFGYEKWETENSMGLDEFCTSRNYRTTLKETQQNFSNVCKFVASGYSIEVTRNKEYVSDATTDWRYDNDVFIICVRRDGSNIVVEQGTDCANTGTMTNIIDPATIYNYRISPIRNFMRWIKSYMATYFNNINSANAKFIFTDGDGNFIVDGVLTTGCIEEAATVSENETINVASFADPNEAKPIYKNELVEFSYPLSVAEFQLIQANPRGIIQYRRLSTDSYSEGYIYDIQYKPNDGIATFQLLPKFT